MKYTGTILCLLLCVACGVAAQTRKGLQAPSEATDVSQNNGVPSSGFPQWSERVLLEWTNRARSDPQFEMTQCGSACGDAACYQPIAPLAWSLNLNRSARFHSDEMQQQGYLASNSECTLVTNISSLYPPSGSCNGAASCACVGGTQSCSSFCTTWDQRISLFGVTGAGEIEAGGTDPNSAFYTWLFASYPTTTNCQIGSTEPHRWNLLMQNGSVGFGADGSAVGDFSLDLTDPSSKIPSGAHYPQQAASVAVWANWYDTSGPTQANVVVDGWPISLTLSRGTSLNGAWTATLRNVASGCHRYYFDFKDSTPAAVQYPDTGSFAIGTGSACADYSSSRPAATSTSLASSASTALVGTPVTFTATVAPSTSGTPTGLITFYDGLNTLGSSALNASAQATLTTTSLALGSHNISASYSGDTSFAPSTSAPLVQSIVAGVSVTPNPVNFGGVALGTKTAAVKVTVKNLGTTAVSISSVGVTGTNATDFGISATTCTSGLVLNAGKSCTVSVYFQPSVVGGRTATLTINDNGPGNPQTAQLNGTGLNVFLSPSTTNYGTQLIGSNTTKKIALKNNSTSLVNINSITASGDYAVSNKTCTATLAAGTSCTISVTFHPTAMNTRTGTLGVSDDATGSPQTAALTGMGTFVSFSPSLVNFGSVAQGSSSTQNVTLTNHNTVTLNITNIAIKGTNAADFSVVAGTTTCGTSVPAGQSCVVAVQFTAGVLGTRSASLSVSDDGGGSPQLVNLKATSF